MQHRLINIVAAGSLALCVAVCALWVRSHFVAVEVSICEGDFRAGNPWTIGLGSDRGMLWVRRSRIFGDGPPSRLFVQRTARTEFWKKPPQAGISAENAPVDRGRSPKAKGYRWHVYLPHWAVTLVLIVLPLRRAVRGKLALSRPGERPASQPVPGNK